MSVSAARVEHELGGDEKHHPEKSKSKGEPSEQAKRLEEILTEHPFLGPGAKRKKSPIFWDATFSEITENSSTLLQEKIFSCDANLFAWKNLF